MRLQKAVKQETVAVAVGTGIGCIALIALFLILHLIFPESTVKFDYRVVLGALAGGAVAVANFFLMALTVQSVVNVENKDDALRMMRVSYRNRMLMRAVWIIVAIVAPCFNYAAGIIPLFIPSFVIKFRGIRMGITGGKSAPTGDADTSGPESPPETEGPPPAADGEGGGKSPPETGDSPETAGPSETAVPREQAQD